MNLPFFFFINLVQDLVMSLIDFTIARTIESLLITLTWWPRPKVGSLGSEERIHSVLLDHHEDSCIVAESVASIVISNSYTLCVFSPCITLSRARAIAILCFCPPGNKTQGFKSSISITSKGCSIPT